MVRSGRSGNSSEVQAIEKMRYKRYGDPYKPGIQYNFYILIRRPDGYDCSTSATAMMSWHGPNIMSWMQRNQMISYFSFTLLCRFHCVDLCPPATWLVACETLMRRDARKAHHGKGSWQNNTIFVDFSVEVYDIQTKSGAHCVASHQAIFQHIISRQFQFLN